MSMFKKITAALLVMCLVFGTMTATAAGKGRVYESKTSDYVATKISHPEAGIGEPDGIINYDSGEADRGQSYSWSAVGYGEDLYVGTCPGAIWTTIQMMAMMSGLDIKLVKSAVNAAFNGKLYLGDEKNNPDNLLRSVIIKLNTTTGEAKVISGPFAEHGGFRAAIGFNDKIYFCNSLQTPQIIEVDPKNNDKVTVVYQCDEVEPGVSVGIRGITVCDNELVVSMIDNDGAYIVSSANPSEGQDSFKVIADQKDLLDYPAFMYYDAIFGGSIFDMASFNDKLYVTVVAGKMDMETKEVPKKGFALFEGAKDDKGEWSFDLIVGDKKDGAKFPFGFGVDRSSAANLVVHDDYLYVGGYNDPMIAIPQSFLQFDFESLYKDLSQPVSLYRMDKAGNWELVIGEPNEIFPEVKGNMGAGFDNHMCQYIWRMQSFDDKLFVGTFDITGLVRPIAQLCNGDILNNTAKDWGTQIKYIVDLIDILKSMAAPESKDAVKDAKALLNTMKDIKPLLDKGGYNDIKSTEKLQTLLSKAVTLYNNIRKYLPENIAKQLDTVINQENADKLFYFIGTCQYLKDAQEGFDLLVSEDGVNFDVITRDGFGDKYNHGVRTFAVNDNGLFLGTANPFYGTQVWHVEEKQDAPEKPEVPDAQEDTTAPSEDETAAPTDKPAMTPDSQAENDKVEAPDTGASASIAIAASALTAGVVLTLISKKKKEF